jgi:shikimate kinase
MNELPKPKPRDIFLPTKFEIILIGPVGSGKSTIAALLSKRLGLPRRSMDELRWKYYEEIGYDHDLARQKLAEGGFWGLYHYWKPFDAHAVKRLLENFRDCVFDFGGAHSVYEDDGLFEQVRQLLAPYAHVILLLPSPNLDESLQILNTRANITSDEQREVNEHFVRHHSNYDLAKHIVYTNGRTPEETCDEIVTWIRGK